MAEAEDVFEPYGILKRGAAKIKEMVSPRVDTRVTIPETGANVSASEVERQNKRAMELSDRQKRMAGGDYSKRRITDRRYGRKSGR